MGKIFLCFFLYRKEASLSYPCAVSSAVSREPISVEEWLALGSKADDIILFRFVEFQDHLVVIMARAYNESGFFEEGSAHCIAAKVMSLTEVKFFSFAKCISKKMLTG